MPWEDISNAANKKNMAEDPWGEGDRAPRRPKRRQPIDPDAVGQRGSGGSGNGRPPQRGGSDFEDLARNAADQAGNAVRRLGGGGLALLVVAILAIYFAAGGLYQLSPTQGSVNLLFGRATSNGQPGLNWNWPAPIGGRIIVPLRENSFVQGGNFAARTGSEQQLIVTGDKQLISYPILVKWRVDPSALEDFVFAYENPEEVLKLATETVLRDNIGQNLALAAVVENVATIRNEIQRELEQTLTSKAARLGIIITGLEAVDDQPPRVPSSVQEAFNDFQNVQIEETRILEEANRDRNQTLQSARGEAGEISERALQTTADLVAAGLGEAENLRLVYNGYRSDPENAVRRLYEDARRILLGQAEIDATAEELRLDQILTNTFAGQ